MDTLILDTITEKYWGLYSFAERCYNNRRITLQK